MSRPGSFERETRETRIAAAIELDGAGRSEVRTPLGFFTHMLESLARHGAFDLEFDAAGDLKVDQHHLLEDSGFALGRAIDRALGGRAGINRAGYFVFPMDEALAVAAVDLGGRPFCQYEAAFARRFCGDLDTDVLEDFMGGLARGLEANVVVRMPFGRSDHHKIEAVFKALGRALRMACSLDPREIEGCPSVKGAIDGYRDR